MSVYEFVSDSQTTIYKFLKYNSGISTRLLKSFKKAGSFAINGASASIISLLQPNDVITVNIEESFGNIVPENICLDIVFEDNYILAVNKPPNIVTHPTSLHPFGTLANAVAFYYEAHNIRTPIRPVIRLDRDTSGIVIFAKNAFIHEEINRQMKSGTVHKTYLAVVEGTPTPIIGKISAPIARLPGSIITRQVSEDGDLAVTNYKVLEVLEDFSSNDVPIYYSLLEIKPETGRTHQIRVHMQHIGHPIVGDTLYGNKSALIRRQALHAFSYSFIHPMLKQEITLTAQLPVDIRKIIEKKK